MASIKPPPIDWIGRKAPTLAEFEALAEVAYRRLPESFLRACEGPVSYTHLTLPTIYSV